MSFTFETDRPDLAAIVARDADWFAIDPAQGTDFTRVRVSLCGEAANDRRALLALLREAREAIEANVDAGALVARLADLGPS